MLTTRQLVDMLPGPDFCGACAEGLAFADAHPDPEEAISYALEHAELDPTKTSAFGAPNSNDPGAFLRWAAAEETVGADRTYQHYWALGQWRDDVKAHLEGCARILREWVAKMQAEHAEAQRAVYAVQEALEAQCIGGEVVRVLPAGPKTTGVRS